MMNYNNSHSNSNLSTPNMMNYNNSNQVQTPLTGQSANGSPSDLDVSGGAQAYGGEYVPAYK